MASNVLPFCTSRNAQVRMQGLIRGAFNSITDREKFSEASHEALGVS